MTPITYLSATDLAGALKRAAAAHGLHEQETGVADADWQIWYSQFMEREQATGGTGALRPR